MILVIWQLLFIIHNIYIYEKIMSIYVYIYIWLIILWMVAKSCLNQLETIGN
jgi:hypothetical protein